MQTSDAIICDHRSCHGQILSKSDRLISGNCDFHIKCWNSLYGAWSRNIFGWDPEVLTQLEILREEEVGNA